MFGYVVEFWQHGLLIDSTRCRDLVAAQMIANQWNANPMLTHYGTRALVVH